MTDVHIPYLERFTIEARAMNLVNATFGKDAVHEPCIIDIHYLAEFQLNATIDYHRLSTDDTILGLSVLRDGKVNTFGPRGGKYRVQLSENTIVLDSKVLADSPECRERFTVAHECGHLHLHKKCFEHTNSVLAPIQEHRVDPLDGCEMPQKYASSAEWQANQFGAALLMPQPAFRLAFKDLTPGGWYAIEDQSEKEDIVQALADLFGVSRQSVAIRIDTLKLAA